MIMDNRASDKLFRRYMEPRHLGIDEPDQLLVFEARRAVAARKKTRRAFSAGFQNLLGALAASLRLQHLGVTVLLATTGFLYLSELSYRNDPSQELTYESRAALSISNTTISV